MHQESEWVRSRAARAQEHDNHCWQAQLRHRPNRVDRMASHGAEPLANHWPARSQGTRSPASAFGPSQPSASVPRRAGKPGALVGDGEGVEIADAWLAAIALTDAVEPSAAVEIPGRCQVLPQIRPTRHAAVYIIDELLAHEARHVEEI